MFVVVYNPNLGRNNHLYKGYRIFMNNPGYNTPTRATTQPQTTPQPPHSRWSSRRGEDVTRQRPEARGGKTKPMSGIYQCPEYYEIAFSWRKIPQEVDVLEEATSRFALIPVQHFLELGAGNSPHMEELARRGYSYTGLELCEEMIAYSVEKARRIGFPARFVKANMVSFQLDHQVDFAYVMLGSLCVESTNDIISHFDSVGKCLRPGGLYFLDWCISFGQDTLEGGESWEMERDNIRVKASFSGKFVDRVEQISEGFESLEVNDRGKITRFEATDRRRVIFPQEFQLLIAQRSDFEFVGWWNNWDLSSPLRGDQKINRPIALLRRR